MLSKGLSNGEELEGLMQPDNLVLRPNRKSKSNSLSDCADYIAEESAIKTYDELSISELSDKGLLTAECEQSPYFQSVLETEAAELNNVRHPQCRACPVEDGCCFANCKLYDEMYYYYTRGKMESSQICMHCNKYKFNECAGIDSFGTCKFATVDIEKFKDINEKIYDLCKKYGIKELSEKSYIISQGKWKNDFRILVEIRDRLLHEADISVNHQIAIRIINQVVLITDSEGNFAHIDMETKDLLDNEGVPNYKIQYVLKLISIAPLINEVLSNNNNYVGFMFASKVARYLNFNR